MKKKEEVKGRKNGRKQKGRKNQGEGRRNERKTV